jgi:hypothetical protein
MTIAAGTHLGRYEIRSKIGEGGMGESVSGARHKTRSQSGAEDSAIQTQVKPDR